MSDPSFLGRGWSFPPAFTRGGAGVEMVSGAQDIQQSLQILLGTVPGERVLQEPFGCDLQSQVFQELRQGVLGNIKGLIEDAILDNELRITLDRVDAAPKEEDPSVILISVSYTIDGTNSRYNMVFPFYLTEATAAPRV